MEKAVIDFLEERGRYYINIDNDTNLNLVYDILLNGCNIRENPDKNIDWDTIVLFYCGVTCDFNMDYGCMIKYYLMAI
jgi:hypothetical protein